MEIRESSADDFKELEIFMELVDGEFCPPLSLRPGGIQGRIAGSLARGDSNYLIVGNGCELVGALGYKLNWNGEKECAGDVYISFMAVHPKHRGQKMARMLDAALAEMLCRNGFSDVNATTWSTNPEACRMYLQFGYSISEVLKDDRGEGVDTIYFRKNVCQD